MTNKAMPIPDFPFVDPSHPNAIGFRVKYLAKSKGVNNSQLAKKAFLSAGGVCMIVMGLHPPRGSTLKKLAEALGVTPGYLVTGFDKTEKKEEEACLKEEVEKLAEQVRSLQSIMERVLAEKKDPSSITLRVRCEHSF